MDILPCGCTTETLVVGGERRFQIVPCSPDCKYLAFAIAESKRQGKPVIFEEIHD